MKKYDTIFADANVSFHKDTQSLAEEKVEYEILFGNENIVFIKAGAGGTAQGYGNKYLKMAIRIHKQTGSTVICAANPNEPHEDLDEREIRKVIAQKGFSNFTLSFVGVSDGAYLNLSLAKRFPETTKWLGINASYSTVTVLKERLLSFPNVYKILIYGTKDEGFTEVVPAVQSEVKEHFLLKLVHHADHNFTGMVDEFISLADYLYE